MKMFNNFSKSAITLFFTLFLLIQIGCKKDSSKTSSYSIQGLWIGTYTVSSGGPVPSGTAFFFSFSIYPDGTMSYKSKGYYNGSLDYITFASGTWTLTGNTFSFTATTINVAGGGSQHTQTGTATFDSNNGSLTNGTINDPQGGAAPWSMNRIN